MPYHDNADLHRPLVLEYDHYVMLERSVRRLPCVHGVDPRPGAPRCGAIARTTVSELPRLDRAVVEYLHRTEQPGARRMWFCLDCVASTAHPLMVGS